MKLPRIILNPSVAGWIRLLQRERKENIRLRRELQEWQNKYLSRVGATPLFTPREESKFTELPPVGPTQKRLYLERNTPPSAVRSAEEILSVAESRSNGR